MIRKCAVLGAGNIGTAVTHALLGGDCEVVLWNRGKKRLDSFGEFDRLAKTTDLRNAVNGADVVFVCVESPAVLEVIDSAGDALSGTMALVSCAASVGLSALADTVNRYSAQTGVARILPNIAATVGHSVNLFCSVGLNSGKETQVLELCKSLGPVYKLNEADFAAGMALSSCGIAYVARYIRAFMSAGVQMGLSASVSKELAMMAMEGTVALLDASAGEHPEVLVDKVCTPGGVTVAGLNKMEECGFSAAVIQGLLAAARKV